MPITLFYFTDEVSASYTQLPTVGTFGYITKTVQTVDNINGIGWWTVHHLFDYESG